MDSVIVLGGCSEIAIGCSGCLHILLFSSLNDVERVSCKNFLKTCFHYLAVEKLIPVLQRRAIIQFEVMSQSVSYFSFLPLALA